MRTEEIAAGIKLREAGDKIDYRVADPACWKVDGGPSHAEIMMGKGVLFRRADNSRVTGWTQMRGRLDGDDFPMMYVTENCTDFIRTVPALQHDGNNPEDIDSDGEDHCGDAGRYAMMSRPWTRMPELPKPIRGADKMTLGEAWRLARPRSQSMGRIE
jgi:hypothetical protein